MSNKKFACLIKNFQNGCFDFFLSKGTFDIAILLTKIAILNQIAINEFS
jgi:hypothetical protein